MLCLSVVVLAIAPAAAAAAPICGPHKAKTLGKSAEARVYVQDGSVRACHEARRGPYRLGARAAIIDVQVVGRYASVRGRTANGQSLRVFDLRRARPQSDRREFARIGVRKLDSTGIAVFHASTRAGGAYVTLSTGGGIPAPPRVDDVGVRHRTLGYSAGGEVEFYSAGGDESFPNRPATDGTLLTAEGVRFYVSAHGMRVRRDGGRWVNIAGRPVGDANTPSSAEGWAPMRVAKDKLVVPFYDRGGGFVWRYDLITGERTDACPTGTVQRHVITEAGKVACTTYVEQGVQVVSENVTVDSGPSIDPRSLVRRGDLLVWLNGGAERTAPIPR
jgi:hypothetical protein